MARTLVVSAFEPEIAPLRPLLAARHDVQADTVGIGAIDAAVGAARAIAAARASRVIFVGTAGVYLRGTVATTAIEATAIAGELHNVSTAALRGEGYLPELVVVRAQPSEKLVAALAACARGPGRQAQAVACPMAITRSAKLARQIASATGATLENLEAFAVCRAASAAGIDFAAVLGVANRVGPAGHREWLEHHRAASRAACRLVARFLEAS